MSHHLASDPIVIHRNGVLRFIDWDFGFRDRRAEASIAHLKGWLTRRDGQRANVPAMRKHLKAVGKLP